MKLKIVNKECFLNNKDFFKENLGYVYNFNDDNYLINSFPSSVKIDKENLSKLRIQANNSIFEQTKKHFLNKEIDFFLSILINDNKICSIANLYKSKNKPWFVMAVETNLEYRNKGYAKKVMKEIEEFVKNSDCKQIFLSTWKTNFPAISLYKSLGYEVIDDKIDLSCYDDIDYNNNILFCKKV